MKRLWLVIALSLPLFLLTGIAKAAPTCTPWATGTPLAATLTFPAPTLDQYGNPLPTGTVLTYNVYMSTTSGTETLVASGKSGSPIVINAGLAAGNTYYFQVAAVDTNGVGVLSNEVCKGPFPSPVPASITIVVT
jgi:predicted phage tail protein